MEAYSSVSIKIEPPGEDDVVQASNLDNHSQTSSDVQSVANHRNTEDDLLSTKVDDEVNYENDDDDDDDIVHQNGGMSYDNGGITHENGGITHENGGMSYDNDDTTHENGDMIYENSDMTYENGDRTHENDDMTYDNEEMSYVYADDEDNRSRLKRRKKCGVCGPCQVRENCNKCRYCLRRDILKQSCIYRKCVHLRKKQRRSLNASSEGQKGFRGHSPSPRPVMSVSPDEESITETAFCLPQPNSTWTSPISSPSPHHKDNDHQSDSGAIPDSRGTTPSTEQLETVDSCRLTNGASVSPSKCASSPPQTDHSSAIMQSYEAMYRLQANERINPKNYDLNYMTHTEYDNYPPHRQMMHGPLIPPHGHPYGVYPYSRDHHMSHDRMPRPHCSPFPPYFHRAPRPPICPTSSQSSIHAPPFFPPPLPPHSRLGMFPPSHQGYAPGGFIPQYPPIGPPNGAFDYHSIPAPYHPVLPLSHVEKDISDATKDSSQFNVFQLTKDRDLMRDKYLKDIEPNTECPPSPRAVSSSPSSPRAVSSSVFTSGLDEDLVQEMDRIKRVDPCNVTVTVDDLTMQASARSDDGPNNFEIDVDSPSSTASSKDSGSCGSSKNETTRTAECSRATTSLTRWSVTGTVCVRQNQGEDGTVTLELPGHRVQIEDFVLRENVLKLSGNPSELVRFISTPVSLRSPRTITISNLL